MKSRLIAAALLLSANIAQAATLTVPFDFSRGEIGIDVSVKGAPLHVILDTGVDPSAIDTTRAEALDLALDRENGGEASGEGDDKTALVFPVAIRSLTIAGYGFGDIDALAIDMTGMSKQYGKQLDGVLGYSFLTNKITLIDYPGRTLTFADAPVEVISSVRQCRVRYTVPLKWDGEETIPIIGNFQIGPAQGQISLDTGSNAAISLYPAGLALPGMRDALIEKGEVTYSGARGTSTAKSYVLNGSVAFGPFSLPKGQAIKVIKGTGAPESRIANIGNRLFADMKLKMLLDYRNHLITFYGGCR